VALWPVTVELDGEELELADVAADVAIHHGRDDVNASPTATTCQLTLLGVTHDHVNAFRPGVSLRVLVADGAGTPAPRFTGTVTDGTLAVDELTAIAVGRLASVRGIAVGLGNWPSETWSARVARIFQEAGLTAELDLRPDPTFDPLLAPRDATTAGPTTLGDYMGFLAPMVGALVADHLDGRILVQAVGSRTLADAVLVDPALVEYAPDWLIVLPAGNIVTVRYQADQGASVTVTDDASRGLYGDRPSTIDTSYVNAADATARAQTALRRGAYAHWNILQAPILAGLPGLALGDPIVLERLPPSSPLSPWTPIVEGWAEQITGDRWTMQLSLSDPRLSGITPLPWEDVDPALTWATINQTVAWYEAQSPEAIAP